MIHAATRLLLRQRKVSTEDKGSLDSLLRIAPYGETLFKRRAVWRLHAGMQLGGEYKGYRLIFLAQISSIYEENAFHY